MIRASTPLFQGARLRLAKLAKLTLAIPALGIPSLRIPFMAGIFFFLLAPSPRAQYELPEQSPEQFIRSLAAAIDETSLTPRERLGLRLFFDSNLSAPAGVACASCHDPRRAFTGNNSKISRLPRNLIM